MSNTTVLQELGAATLGSNKGLYLGSGLLGQLVDACLMGVGFLMFIHWVTWGTQDSLTTKILVWLSVIFSFGVSFFNFGCLLHFFGYGYGDYSLWLRPRWLGWTYMLNALVLATAQLFFLERAFKLYNKSFAVLVPLFALVLASLASGVGKTICLVTFKLREGVSAQDSSPYSALFYVWIRVTLALELALAVLLSLGLWRSKSAWERSDSVPHKVSKIIWEAQLPATLVTFIYGIIEIAQPGQGVGDFFEKWYSKAFSVGLLVVLNSRFSLAKARDTSENTWSRRNATSHQATVLVNTETYIERSQGLPPKVGLNRQPGSQLSLEDLSEDGKSPIEDLAFIHNDSSMGLTTPQEDDIKVVLR